MMVIYVFFVTRSDADMAILARFSKNFLPILFGLYATPPSSDEATPLTKEGNSGESGEEKGYLVECIRAYLSITSTCAVVSPGIVERIVVVL